MIFQLLALVTEQMAIFTTEEGHFRRDGEIKFNFVMYEMNM